MEKNCIKDNPELRSQIEQWAVRCKRANKRLYKLADEAGVSPAHLSVIINMKSPSVRQSTIDSIEKALKSWGV